MNSSHLNILTELSFIIGTGRSDVQIYIPRSQSPAWQAQPQARRDGHRLFLVSGLGFMVYGLGFRV